MNNQLKGLLYYFQTHMKRSFLIFWSILLGITIVTLIAAYILRNEDGVMTITLTMPMYFFCAIYGFVIVKQWIPYFIKIGATRKNIFLGLGIFFAGVASIYSLMATILQSAISFLVDKLTIDIFSFIHLSMVFEDTWYIRFIIDFTVMLVSFTFSYVVAFLFYNSVLLLSRLVIGALF